MSGTPGIGVAGKVVAVTGASSGIGEATARFLAGRGAPLVLGGRRRERLEALSAEIGEGGGEALALTVDVSRRADLQRLVDATRERFGRLDVLISNAGVGPISPLDALRVDKWEQMVDVNLKGVLYGVAAALPVFREQGFGHFVHLASTAGLKTVANQAVYSATKVAVRAFSEGLRQEAGERLRVTQVRTMPATSLLLDGVAHLSRVNGTSVVPSLPDQSWPRASCGCRTPSCADDSGPPSARP